MAILRSILAISLLALAACAPRGVVELDPSAAGVGESYPVFVGTSREPDPVRRFGAGRSTDLLLGRYDISVPPAHTPGNIEWPRAAPDPLTDFLATSETLFENGAGFQAALKQELSTRPRGERTAVVYVHGFNNTFADGLYRLAQMAHDFDLPDVAVHYSWPSAANPLGYGYDRDSLLFARDGLEELLRLVRGAGAENILLVGHSLGGLLTMEVLRQIAIADDRRLQRALAGVVLISPDIDVDLFRKQASRIGALPQPFVIFASEKDRALQLSARLTGQAGRLGTQTDPGVLAELEVTIFDVTAFSNGPIGHFSAATSPALIRILRLLPGIDRAFARDRAGRAGLLPGTVLTVQNATQVILSPTTVRTE